MRYTDRLDQATAVASVGAKGDSSDNAMAEALNSLYKAELIGQRTWGGIVDVEAGTAAWVGWFNTGRLHSMLGYATPRRNRNRLQAPARHHRSYSRMKTNSRRPSTNPGT